MTYHSRHPYEVSADAGGRPFLAIEHARELLYLPCHALRRMRLGDNNSQLTLEFAEESVELTGKGLDQIADLIANTRCTLLRVGEIATIGITHIRVIPNNA